MIKDYFIAICLALALIAGLPHSAVAGEELWAVEISEEPEWYRIAHDGTFLIGTESALINIDALSGNERWRRADIRETSPADVTGIEGASMMLVHVPGEKRRRDDDRPARLELVNMLSGDPIWSAELPGRNFFGAIPVMARQQLVVFEYVDARKRKERGTDMVSYHLLTGEEQWRVRLTDHKADFATDKGYSFAAYPEPLIEGETLYLPFLGLHAVDLNTGRIKWGEAFQVLDKGLRKTSADPIIVGPNLIAAGLDTFYGFNTETGYLLWENELNRASFIAEFVPAGNVLVARLGGLFTDGRELENEKPYGIAAISAVNGEEIWRYDDLKDGVATPAVDIERNLVVFADAQAIIGTRLSSGITEFEAPLAFFRKYGLFKEKSGGFSIGGGFSKLTGLGQASGGSGGLSFGSGGPDVGDLPLKVDLRGNEFVLRGRQSIMEFDRRVNLLQWSIIFGDTGLTDNSLLRRGELPEYSLSNVGYFMTILPVGKGDRAGEMFSVLGIDKNSGRVVARQDLPGDPEFVIDHRRNRLFRIVRERKRTVLIGYGL